MMTDGGDGDPVDPEELAIEFERRIVQLESTVREAHDDLLERLRDREDDLALRERRVETMARELQTVEERVQELEAELAVLRDQ